MIQSTEQNKLIGSWIRNDAERAVALTYSEKRIGDFTREDMTKLVEIMAQWRVLLGVTSDPTEQELIIICQFMYDNFKQYTLADVRLAMNWAIAGKLDIGFVSQKNISSYYVSRAMNAYDEAKRHIFNNLMEERERHLSRQIELEKSKPTPQEEAESFKGYAVSLYKSYNDGTNWYDISDIFYNWLKRTGQMNPTQKEIAEAVQYGKTRYMEDRQGDSLKDKLTKTVEPQKKEEQQRKYAREYMIRLYFDKTPLGKIVDKINPSQFTEK